MNLKKICVFSCALFLSASALVSQGIFINDSCNLQVSAEMTTTTSKVTTVDDSYVNLYLKTPPTKTTYIIGEELNLDGATIYGNGYEASAGMYWDIFDSPLTQYATIDDSQFDNTKEGTYTIYGKYMGETVSFKVSVIEKFQYEQEGVLYEVSNKNGNVVAVPLGNTNGVELPKSLYIPALNGLYTVSSTGDTPPTQLTDDDYDVNYPRLRFAKRRGLPASWFTANFLII